MTSLEDYFAKFRRNIIGVDQTFRSPYGGQPLVYADWTASGRLYGPIEERIVKALGPFVGNTHTEAAVTGARMTHAYVRAREIVKEHVNAGPSDVILTPGFGMTTAVVKFQRMLGLKVPDPLRGFVTLPDELRPVVFVTHMEHHSNHTSWLETVCDVVTVDPDERGLVDLNRLETLLDVHDGRQVKIGAFTACSNVTGIQLPVHDMAKIMHRHGGYCFVDYAASAPYVKIDMRPEDPSEKLDAILFSPHKFLGGPGASGVLIFDSGLYESEVPDQPGGGTVDWTNPWGGRKYVHDIEEREDGGTPGFLQATRTGLCVRLKEEMGVEKMAAREQELLKMAFEGLRKIPRLRILADHIEDRLGVISFYIEDVHYNLVVKLLNDRFGIQTRGGCVCAGTYGHYLLNVDPVQSKQITDKIDEGDLSEKPGWVRISLHPTTTDEELEYIIDALGKIAASHGEWSKDYTYSVALNEYRSLGGEPWGAADLEAWFDLEDE